MAEETAEVPELELTLIHVQEDRFSRIQRLGFDEDTATVQVDGAIDEEFGGWFSEVHHYLVHRPTGQEVITVKLNTGGGDVQSMFMFCDTVRMSPAPIHIIGHGNVCSAGVLMLACGHKRFVTRHCVMMVHQYAHSGDEGDGLRYQEAKERRKWEDWTHQRMIELMAEYSGRDVRYWKGVFEKKPEHWLLGGQQIVEEGLADEVLPY